MSKYDPTFWEVSVDPTILEDVLVDPDSLDQLLIAPEDERAIKEKEQHRQAAMTLILQLIQTQLTPRQRQIIQMYFYENRTQQEIAAQLGINQQVVSKHLFGVVRDGRKVGGALKKLRKLCEKQGIDPQKWV
jgi:RNA polymerase sigma factor (sigma-70 family)